MLKKGYLAATAVYVCTAHTPDILKTYLENLKPIFKTIIKQEMLKKGDLAETEVYVCTAHTPDISKTYLENLKPIFQTIKECEEGRDVMKLLEGPVAHNGFKRLN